MRVLIILALAACAAASTQYAYHGKYAGKCEQDGIYYRDYNSYVYCSNGNSYVQPCAPGTKNSGHAHFTYGSLYSFNAFCDVNLVAGQHAHHVAHAATHKVAAYAAPAAGYGYGVAGHGVAGHGHAAGHGVAGHGLAGYGAGAGYGAAAGYGLGGFGGAAYGAGYGYGYNKESYEKAVAARKELAEKRVAAAEALRQAQVAAYEASVDYKKTVYTTGYGVAGAGLGYGAGLGAGYGADLGLGYGAGLGGGYGYGYQAAPKAAEVAEE